MILSGTPAWFRDVPFQVKSIAVKDACLAFTAQKLRVKQGIIPSFEMHFRSRRNPTQSCFIPHSAIKPTGDRSIGIYPRIAGDLWAAEPVPQQHRDSRLVWDNGAWYLSVSFSVTMHKTTENQGRMVALDPGVRTFLTFYSPALVGKIGDQSQQRIVRLLFHLDRLMGRRAKADGRGKRRLTLGINRLRRKINNLIDELHWKSIRFLLDNFDVICIPAFSAKEMSCRAKRRLRKKSVRSMLGLAHSRFRMRLIAKADQEGKTVRIINEAYTSKTCSWSGEIIANLGGRRVINGSDGVSMDRDINGARGIYLRALGDTPAA